MELRTAVVPATLRNDAGIVGAALFAPAPSAGTSSRDVRVSTTAVRTDVDTLAINTNRGLCIDQVQKANSGHPGTPMGIAPVAYTPTPLKQLLIKFGFTPDRVAQVAHERVAAARRCGRGPEPRTITTQKGDQ